MQFVVQDEIFDSFPGLCLPVAVAHGLDNRIGRETVETEWREAWLNARSAAAYGNAQSHPRIQPWRERFRALGVSGKEFPCSAEALLRRALKGGEPFRINPLVDFYNSVSLNHFVPAGAFDLGDVRDTLELRFTRVGDQFVALDDETPVRVSAGEVAYASGQTILTRHFVWRQARAGLVTPATNDVFLIAEVLGEVGPNVAGAVLADFRRGLQDWFSLEAATFLVNRQNPSINWL